MLWSRVSFLSTLSALIEEKWQMTLSSLHNYVVFALQRLYLSCLHKYYEKLMVVMLSKLSLCGTHPKILRNNQKFSNHQHRPSKLNWSNCLLHITENFQTQPTKIHSLALIKYCVFCSWACRFIITQSRKWEQHTLKIRVWVRNCMKSPPKKEITHSRFTDVLKNSWRGKWWLGNAAKVNLYPEISPCLLSYPSEKS